MAVVIVVGAQWGDEGKGKIVDLLTERVRYVVRWAGGANAGHTLVVDGKKYVTRLIPSGVLRAGITCVLGEAMVVDPVVLVEEIRAFRAQGFLARHDNLVVAARAHLTLPYHREIDRLRDERAENAIGTTRKGIGPTYESKAARTGLRVGDLLHPERFRAQLARQIEALSPLLAALGGAAPDATEIAAHYLALARGAAAVHRRRLEAREPGDRARRQRHVRGRAGRAARHRPRHVSVRDVVVGDGGRRVRRPGHRADHDRHRARESRRATRRASAADRSRPSSATRPAICCASAATSSVRSPGGRAAAAGSTFRRCGSPSARRGSRASR